MLSQWNPKGVQYFSLGYREALPKSAFQDPISSWTGVCSYQKISQQSTETGGLQVHHLKPPNKINIQELQQVIWAFNQLDEEYSLRQKSWWMWQVQQMTYKWRMTKSIDSVPHIWNWSIQCHIKLSNSQTVESSEKRCLIIVVSSLVLTLRV